MTDPDVKLLCPFCNHELDVELYNGTYGCDTGCDYVTFEVECPYCKRDIYSTGNFGEFENEAEEAEYREQYMKEFAQAVQKINAAKAAGAMFGLRWGDRCPVCDKFIHHSTNKFDPGHMCKP